MKHVRRSSVRNAVAMFLGWFGLVTGSSIAAGAQAASMPPTTAPSVLRATPALWAVRDADTVIYLFGTFHSLDARTVWFNASVRDAFERSDQLVLETVVPSTAEGLRAARNAALAGENGQRRPTPFMVQTKTAVDQNRAAGLAVDRGVDAVLRRVAEQNGKRVAGLELFAEQLSTLAGIKASPPAAPATATAIPAITASDLLSAWTTGNTGAMSTMLSGFEAKSPAAYRTLIADRNARWGQWVADRLDRPGTVFVAVGSGHLAGKDSVQEWLLARGIEAVRVG